MVPGWLGNLLWRCHSGRNQNFNRGHPANSRDVLEESGLRKALPDPNWLSALEVLIDGLRKDMLKGSNES